MILNKKQVQKTLAIQGARAIAVAVLAAIVSFYFAGKLRAISSSLVQEKKLALILEARSRGAESVREDRSLIAQKSGRLEQALFSTDEILEFLGALETLAGKYALTTSVRFSDPVFTSNPSVVMIAYTINLNGNIFTMLQYLRDFERLPYFTSINAFRMNSGETGWAADSSITLTARVYARAE